MNVNEIRTYLDVWRWLRKAADRGVTLATLRLLQHRLHHEFNNQRLFSCQSEAIETVIWLNEIARGKRQFSHIFWTLEGANAHANQELFRPTLKLATGAGKTTGLATLIVWEAIKNAR